MTIKEINEKTDAELERELAALRGAVRDMRFKLASRQLKAVRSLRAAKKSIARIMTAMTARRKAGAKGAKAVA